MKNLKLFFVFILIPFLGCVSLKEHEALVDILTKKIDQCTKYNNVLRNELDRKSQEKENISLELKILQQQKQELEISLKKEINEGKVRLTQRNNRLILNIDNKICFPSGSATLGKEAEGILEKVIINLQNFKNNQIYVEGNTDNVPVRKGSWIKDNWELSAERAASVTRFLQTKVSPERFSIVGHSYFNAIVPNDTEENKRLNRRVDIIIIPN
ncbi:MAG TPA: flagellar motor protein MotB [Methanofastidiosum sp.]|nr:flagellar motor protein MotB [Methanofastidiosum sp.]